MTLYNKPTSSTEVEPNQRHDKVLDSTRKMTPDMPTTEFSRVADQMVLKMILRSKMADEMAQYKAQTLAKEKTLAFNSLNSASRKRPQPAGKDSLEQVKPQKLQKRDEEDDLTKWARAEREAAEQLIKEIDEIINAEQKDFPIQPLREMSFDELINEIDDILRENSEQTSLGQTTKQEVNVEKPTFTSDDSYTANKPLLLRPTALQRDIAQQISHDTPELPKSAVETSKGIPFLNQTKYLSFEQLCHDASELTKPTVETSAGIPFLNQTKYLSFEQLCHDASELPKQSVETYTGIPFLKIHEPTDQVRNTKQQEPRCLSIEKPSQSLAAGDLRSKLLKRRVDSQQQRGTFQKQTYNDMSSGNVLKQQTGQKNARKPALQAVYMRALQQPTERIRPRYIPANFSSGAYEQPTSPAVYMPAMQPPVKRQKPRYTSARLSSGAYEQPTSPAVAMPALQPPVKRQKPRYIPAWFSSGAYLKPMENPVPVMCVPDVKWPPTIDHSLNFTPPRKRPPTIDSSRYIPPPGKRPPTIHHSLNIPPPGKPDINHAVPTWQGAGDARKRKATQDQDEAQKPKKKFRLIPVGFP